MHDVYLLVLETAFEKSRGAHEREMLFQFGSAIIWSNYVRVSCNGYCNVY